MRWGRAKLSQVPERVVELSHEVIECRNAPERLEVVDELGDAYPHSGQLALSFLPAAPGHLRRVEKRAEENLLGIGEGLDLAHVRQLQGYTSSRVTTGLPDRRFIMQKPRPRRPFLVGSRQGGVN